MKSQTPLDDRELRAIGSITATFARLDVQLDLCLWPLITRDPSLVAQRRARIVTAELTFSQKVHMFGSLCRHLNGGKEPPELGDMVKRLSLAEEKRNTILHSFWAASPDIGSVTRAKVTAKRRSGLRVQFETMTAEDMEDIAEFLGDLGNDLLNYYVEKLHPAL